MELKNHQQSLDTEMISENNKKSNNNKLKLKIKLCKFNSMCYV